jgi:serine/threonine protein kinase
VIQNAASAASGHPNVIFEDHLGTRFEAVSPEGEPVEVFELKEQFAGVPSFEYALRKRVNTLTTFRDPSFASARGVRLGGSLAVVGDRVRGTRLSTVVEAFERDLIPVEFNAAVCVLRQLVPAVAILHETMPDICHGAIAPERIVITPEGRVVIVEHELASALEALHYSDQQYWEELRIAVPKTAGPSCFDQRSDVLQIGLVVLALIHGRSLNSEEYPVPAASLSERAWAATASGGLEPLPAALRTWLNRTLQLEPKQAFGTATTMWSELKQALPQGNPAELQALKRALARYGFDSLPALPTPAKGMSVGGSHPSGTSTPAVLAPPPAATPVRTPVSTPTPALTPARTPVPAPAAIRPQPSVASAPTPATPIRVPAALTSAASQSDSGPVSRTIRANVHDVSQPGAPKPRPSVSAAGAVSGVEARTGEGGPKATGGSTTIRLPRAGEASTAQQSSGAQDSHPARAFPVPPKPYPSTSARGALSGGEGHGEDGTVRETSPQDSTRFAIQEEEQDDMRHNSPWWRRRSVAAALFVLVAAGVGVAGRSYMAPSASAAVPGTLLVETNPPGIPLMLDGKRSGETPVRLEVAAGSHVLTLLTEGTPRTIPLTITAGATVSQFFDVPKPVAETGQLQIRTEPSGARVVVDGTPRGTAPVTVEGLMPGAHTVEVSNDTGSIRQEITVAAGTTSSLVVPMSTTPQGALSGYISVAAPVDVQIYEDVRLVGSSRSDRLMVSVGRHEFDIVNEALGYRTRRVVNVAPGQVAVIKLDWPNGSMAINAQPWAEVFIDGERIGETPIGNVPVPIGPHEVRFRHPELGEQVVRSTVTLGSPARLSVDLRKR